MAARPVHQVHQVDQQPGSATELVVYIPFPDKGGSLELTTAGTTDPRAIAARNTAVPGWTIVDLRAAPNQPPESRDAGPTQAHWRHYFGPAARRITRVGQAPYAVVDYVCYSF